MRFFRLVVGIFIMAHGFTTGQWILVAMGGFFSLMPLLNIGCCATGTCSVPATKKKGNKLRVGVSEKENGQ